MRPIPELLAPPTRASGDLTFVVAAMGDSFAAGEGAPDVPGSYRKPDLRQCRDEANAFPRYTEAEFAALGAITGLAARLFAIAGPAVAEVTEVRDALAAFTAARTAEQNARAALAAAQATLQQALAGNIAAAIASAQTALTRARPPSTRRRTHCASRRPIWCRRRPPCPLR